MLGLIIRAIWVRASCLFIEYTPPPLLCQCLHPNPPLTCVKYASNNASTPSISFSSYNSILLPLPSLPLVRYDLPYDETNPVNRVPNSSVGLLPSRPPNPPPSPFHSSPLLRPIPLGTRKVRTRRLLCVYTPGPDTLSMWVLNPWVGVLLFWFCSVVRPWAPARLWGLRRDSGCFRWSRPVGM